ncbi:hypothetical protein [Micromonospora antibiotica]|uniref:Thioesterase domain-containing protein n=1 Tax=Micromonospora antibiotica TaxID=2807623 RepID=A0ABS3VA45_9ACTN|nr:hypothetical protein [Micromonospora antibiotica]
MVRSGDVLRLSRAASVQFVRPITVRVIRVLTDWHTYDGWVWIDAYVLDAAGDAVSRRTLFLQPAGAGHLKAPVPGPATRTPATRTPAARTPAARTPAARTPVPRKVSTS